MRNLQLIVLIPLFAPVCHHLLHILHFSATLHPLFHHFFELLSAQLWIILQNIPVDLFDLCFRLSLRLDLLQQIIIPSLSFNRSEFLDLFGVFDELVIFKCVRAVVQFVQELKKFTISVFWISTIRKHIYHVFGNVTDLGLLLRLLLLLLLNVFSLL